MREKYKAKLDEKTRVRDLRYRHKHSPKLLSAEELAEATKLMEKLAKPKLGDGKIFGFAEGRMVFINGRPLGVGESLKVVRHSPDGFSWGYAGSGPSQLSLAIMLYFMEKGEAVKHHQDFKFSIISQLEIGRDFIMDLADVKRWILGREGILKSNDEKQS